MGEAIRVRDLPGGSHDGKQRKRAKFVREAPRVFEGKKFAELSPKEKDDLLKALAVVAGLVEE